MKTILLTILLILSRVLYSQDLQAPVSPNIASMGEFGNFPIGYYTGTPVIEFPLYEINLDGLIIPIKLKYNSSGIRVDQDAGWVGLGWFLETGGHITKEIRGLDDFVNWHSPISSQQSTLGNYYMQSYLYDTYVKKMNYNPKTKEIEGEILPHQFKIIVQEDTEPDIYHFNFCNYSGTFYFDPGKKEESLSDFIKPVIKSSNQQLDITYNKKDFTLYIIDQKGFRFNFTDKEYTQIYKEKTAHENINFRTDKSTLSSLKVGAYTETSWQLTSIESPTGKKVLFTYDKECLSTPLMSFYYSDIPLCLEDLNLILFEDLGSEFYTYTYSAIRQLLPKNISFDGGDISFITSERKDVDNYTDPLSQVRPTNGSTFLPPQKLDRIIIKTKLDDKVKDIKFNYNYMGDETDYNKCRLMLNSFEVSDQQIKLSYKDGVLPIKNSYNTDLWGYYNGIMNNTKQTPTYTIRKQASKVKKFLGYPESEIFEGADRFPNQEYMQYGILNMIEYPTGGKTKFVYEPHEFYNDFVSGYSKKYIYGSAVTYNPDDLSQQSDVYTYGKDFILEEDSYVRLTYHYHVYNSSQTTLPSIGYVHLQEKLQKYNTVYSRLINIDKTNETINFDTDAIYLKKGTYRIYLWRETQDQNGQNKPFNYYVTADVTAFTPHRINKGGGLRIKEIQNIDNGKIVNKKQYSYLDKGLSSGCLLSIPDYSYLQILDSAILDSLYLSDLLADIPSIWYNGKLFAPRFRTSFIPNNGASTQIGYKYVEENNINAGNITTGKTTYRYMAEPTNRTIPCLIPRDFHLGNGSLLEKSDYDNEGKLQKKLDLRYSFKSIPGASTMYVPKFYIPAESYSAVRFYEVKPEFWSLDSTLETDYFDHGRNFASKRTGYKYDMKNRLVNIQTVTFGNTFLVTRTKFAKDFTDQIAGKMVEKNMIGIPLETITLKDEKIISGSKTQYVFNAGLNAVLKKGSCTLKQVPSLTLANNYSQYFEEDYTVSKYDDSGNPVEIINKDGTHDIYLWSYNGQYVVAEIRNSTYAVVNSALSSVGLTSIASLSTNTNPDKLKLDKLRSQPTLSDARITTYKFMPLIGITQMTDASGFTTYYEYDTFGRLIRTKDLDNNMIQKNDYHYRNE